MTPANSPSMTPFTYPLICLYIRIFFYGIKSFIEVMLQGKGRFFYNNAADRERPGQNRQNWQNQRDGFPAFVFRARSSEVSLNYRGDYGNDVENLSFLLRSSEICAKMGKGNETGYIKEKHENE